MKKTVTKCPKVIGLTGNTGCGKTTVADIFREIGAAVIDADRIGKEALENNKDLRRFVIESFGNKIVDETGEIIRKKLGAIVFSDPDKLQRLNELIYQYLWPEVKRRIEEEKSREAPMIVVDAALIFEAGIESWFDEIIVVTADDTVALERIIRRDQLTREEALARMRSQMDVRKKITAASYVITNNGDLAQLRSEVLRIYHFFAVEKS